MLSAFYMLGTTSVIGDLQLSKIIKVAVIRGLMV